MEKGELTKLPPGAGAVLAGDVPTGYMAGAIATGLGACQFSGAARWWRVLEDEGRRRIEVSFSCPALAHLWECDHGRESFQLTPLLVQFPSMLLMYPPH